MFQRCWTNLNKKKGYGYEGRKCGLNISLTLNFMIIDFCDFLKSDFQTADAQSIRLCTELLEITLFLIVAEGGPADPCKPHNKNSA